MQCKCQRPITWRLRPRGSTHRAPRRRLSDSELGSDTRKEAQGSRAGKRRGTWGGTRSRSRPRVTSAGAGGVHSPHAGLGGHGRPPPPSHMSTVETTTQAARHGAEEKKCTFPQEGGFLVMRGDRRGLGQKRHGVVAFWLFPTIRRFTRQSLPPTEGRSGCPECHWDLAGRLGDHLSLGLSLFSPPTRPSSFSFSL